MATSRKALQAQAEAAAAAALQACLDYMHVDEDDNGRIENEFIPAAKAYLAGAGIAEPTPDDPLYTLAVHALTLHFYDHRDSVGGEAPLPIGLRPVINQLKHSGAGCI